MNWRSHPKRFGAFRFQRLPNEGEQAGVEYDKFTREPVRTGKRKPHSLRPRYAFIDFVNAWREQDWPPEKDPALGPEPPQEWKTIRPGDPEWAAYTSHGEDKILFTPIKPAPGFEHLLKFGGLALAEHIKWESAGQPQVVGKVVESYIQTNPAHNEWTARANDRARHEAFAAQSKQQAYDCVLRAVSSIKFAELGQRTFSRYHDRLTVEQRQQPDQSMLHHVAGLARQLGDALCEAVAALSKRRRVPEGVWRELRQRGAPVILNMSAEPPGPSSSGASVAISDALHVFAHTDVPGWIISRAVQYLVGSFFFHLIAQSAGSAESIRVCEHCNARGKRDCSRLFVGRGRASVCDVHSGDEQARRSHRRASSKSLWNAARGSVSRRTALVRRWHPKEDDVDGRVDDLVKNRHRHYFKRKVNFRDCSYDQFLKAWAATRPQLVRSQSSSNARR